MKLRGLERKLKNKNSASLCVYSCVLNSPPVSLSQDAGRTGCSVCVEVLGFLVRWSVARMRASLYHPHPQTHTETERHTRRALSPKQSKFMQYERTRYLYANRNPQSRTTKSSDNNIGKMRGKRQSFCTNRDLQSRWRVWVKQSRARWMSKLRRIHSLQRPSKWQQQGEHVLRMLWSRLVMKSHRVELFCWYLDSLEWMCALIR